MMNNFMASNLPQQFYNSGGAGASAYSYDINLNAVNSGVASTNVNGRSNSNDYENNPKSIYMSSKNTNQNPKIQTGGNNVIVEMEAENNDEESYYLSNSPVRNKNGAPQSN